ncbi:DNA-directed RNA polymerase specialized sigma24 family protein [Sphingosinicella soli]|uniref:DNA-directed RNA polymerase specialized sigma24 family protein n=2 Tax=Sphingosinicella soli TaxID=333708 RepID=A0A7W7B3P9_9SPHN|nr:DNA-directed RNA polymerase specialized sigma24 family protein [Sphingosinicella soli]
MAHRFEELTYPEIAARMGVCVKTVEKHISLALRALHRELGKAE